jgi:hypothetical protein
MGKGYQLSMADLIPSVYIRDLIFLIFGFVLIVQIYSVQMLLIRENRKKGGRRAVNGKPYIKLFLGA